jgi:putative ABC transport system permease protein
MRLVAVQFGIYLGSRNRIAAMLDHTEADLWVVPFGTKSFDDPSLLPGHEKHAILSMNARNGKSPPLDTIVGSCADVSSSNAGGVDFTCFKELGMHNRGDRAEVNNMQVTAQVITWGIRSFTTLPYVFTTVGLARELLDATPDEASYEVARVAPDYSVGDVRKEVVAYQEFRKRSLDYWLFENMCEFAPISAIFKLTHIDPAVVFSR